MSITKIDQKMTNGTTNQPKDKGATPLVDMIKRNDIIQTSFPEGLQEYAQLRFEASKLLAQASVIFGRAGVRKIIKGDEIPGAEIQPIDMMKVTDLIHEGKVSDAMAILSSDVAFVMKGNADEISAALSNTLKSIDEMERKNENIKKEYFKYMRDRLAIGRELYTLRQFIDTCDVILWKYAKSLEEAKTPEVIRGELVSDIIKQTRSARDAAENRMTDLYKNYEENAMMQETLYNTLIDRSDLLRFGHMTTEVQKELEEKLRKAMENRKPLFLLGHTGTGKTSGLKAAYRKMGLDPIVFACGIETTQYDLFGIGGASVEKTKEGEKTEIGVKPAGISQAIEEDRPIILDEANALRADVLKELNPVLDALSRSDKVVYIPTLGRSMKLGPNFRIDFTGNPKGEQYLGVEQFDNALGRRLWTHNVPYPSEEDMKRVIAAEAIDPILLIFNENALDVGNRLVSAIRLIQVIYSGEKTDFYGHGSDVLNGKVSKLEKATASIDDLRMIFRSWRMRNYEGTPDEEIIDFIQRQNAPQDEKTLLAQIFFVHGFLQDMKADVLKGVVDENTYDGWKKSKQNKP
ncbi:MAG: AAA family ATPase [Candidatus Micrarchaeia archaeon]